ncbi:LysR family transcriptional regulator [Paenibacillus sp. GCM10027627]|uniref:LysR family transcriptional regulator n=1 Tax=unclassified Paenibacillus TaxID=185978 RepID=UPI00363A5BEA
MTITQLLVFSKVIETGSFTKAGEMLNMTQSAVSHAIAGLESELGVPLIIRDKKRGLILSNLGMRILKPTKEVLNNLYIIKQEAAAEKGLEAGTIRVGSFPSTTARLLPKMIGTFKKLYPQIEVVLFEGTDYEVSEWVRNGIIDMGFIAKLNWDESIIPITRDKMVAVLSKYHPFSNYQAIPVEMLADSPFIMPTGGCELIIREIFESSGFSLNIQFQVRELTTILNMVKEGLGVTVIPEFALPDSLPAVVVRELEPAIWRHIGLRCPSTDESSPAAQRFISIGQSLFM